MGFPLQLTQEEYEALIDLARRGAQDDEGNVKIDESRRLEHWMREIERKNGIVRNFVWIRWQELDSGLPPTTSFPETWPPEQQEYLESINRPIAKQDVTRLVDDRANRPTNIMVTRDSGAEVGWQTLDAFFVR
jgi:hypothetical protein